MEKQEYLNLRNGLYDAAQNLINEGKFDEATSKMNEIKELDNKFDNEAKAKANLNALKDSVKITNIANKGVNGVNGNIIDSTNNSLNDSDVYASLEYRRAFMNHIVKGVSIPNEFINADSSTKTSDVGAVIPTTVMEKIVEKIEATGMILPLVTRSSVKAGVSVPISSIKPVATWVAEGKGSDKQKKSMGSVVFAYHKLRCAVSVSLETDTMVLAVFEANLINNVTEAMIKAIEQSIISGTGEGQPKGVLTETPGEGKNIQVVALSYDDLVNAEAALPLEYEATAVWCMTKKTFMSYQGLKDDSGQPIGRVNYGIGGKPERSLLGRNVILCNYLDSYSTTLTDGQPFAFIYNFSDYILNTNLNMTLKKYEDNETDDQVTKAIMLADGKAVDINSLVILTKKVS